jgi:hypothetical protein
MLGVHREPALGEHPLDHPTEGHVGSEQRERQPGGLRPGHRPGLADDALSGQRQVPLGVQRHHPQALVIVPRELTDRGVQLERQQPTAQLGGRLSRVDPHLGVRVLGAERGHLPA